MRDKPWYPILFMFIATFFLSIILIGLSRATRERVEANQRLNFEKAVLRALAIKTDKNTSSLDLHNLYLKKISPPNDTSAGAYIYKENNRIKGYAIPISGKGFWDTIEGIVGIASDKKTLIGIYFYQQAETPGLGAEITKKTFRNQFIGKKLSSSNIAFSIKPIGTPLDKSSVQAITGATQTSIRLGRFLSEQLTQWRNKISAI